MAVFNAQERTDAGTGSARAVRRSGFIPAIIYGEKKDAVKVAISEKEFQSFENSPQLLSTVFDVKFGKNSEKVVVRDMQYDVVTDRPVHIDFHRIGKDQVKVTVPVYYVNEEKSPGLKLGGKLNVIVHDMQVYCAPNKVVDAIEIDMDGVEAGVSLRLEDQKLPEGVTPANPEKDYILATLMASRGAKTATQDATAEESSESAAE